MSFRKKSKNKKRRKNSLSEDSSSSNDERRTSIIVRRDSAIRVFSNNLVDSDTFTEDNTVALEQREGSFQSYMVRNEGQKTLLVDLFPNTQPELDLGNQLKEDLEDLNDADEEVITQVILKMQENNFDRGIDLVESMLTRLNEENGLDLATLEEPVIVDLDQGQYGMVFNIGNVEVDQEGSLEDESDSDIVLNQEEGEIQGIIPRVDEAVELQAALLHGGQPAIQPQAIELAPRQVVQPVAPPQPVILNPIPNAIAPVIQPIEQPPLFVAPVNPSRDLPTDAMPVMLDPQRFRKALDFGRIGKPSKELQTLFAAMDRYQSRIQQFRGSTIDNGFDEGRFEHQVQFLNQDNGIVVQAAIAYMNKTNSEAKKAIVRTMLKELGNPFSSQNNLLRSTTDLTPPNFVEAINRLQTGTASEVYTITANRRIGNSNTTNGIAKGELSGEDNGGATIASLLSSVILNSQTQESLADTLLVTNDTTIATLDQQLQNRDDLIKTPSLLVRQVLSSRLDKALGINVIADEEFMTRPSDNSLWGVTAFADGKQARKEINQNDSVFSQHQWFPLSNSNIQKGLSDLQLMDAITGQLDRHLGNLFISNTGQVTGIDNDMAFSFQANNTSSVLKNQFAYVNNTLVYNQSLIDKQTGEKILAMTEQQFLSILQGRSNDPITLSDEGNLAFGPALERFRAVKNKVQQLKNDNQLISNWGDETYLRALDNSQLHKGSEGRPQNYMIMLSKGFQKAQTDPHRAVVI